jgi:hypothetical protein
MLCLGLGFGPSLNPSKSLGNAVFLAIQTEQVHILQVFLQKNNKIKSKWEEIIFFLL